MSFILEDELELLKKPELLGLRIDDYSVGMKYAVVKLSTGNCGVAYYPHDVVSSTPRARRRDAFSVAELALSDNLGERSLGVAAINALSWEVIPKSSVRYGDPTDSIDPRNKIVAMVGYFEPLLPRFSSARELRIIERKEMEGAYPPSKAKEAIGSASIVIITGSALVYGGMEDYLEYSKGAEDIIVMGPTSSMLPEPFFKRGADIVAGVEVTNCKKLLESDKLCRDVLRVCGKKMYFSKSDSTR
ncbi:MAG: Rossmann-like domain-containing protein [Candidatus Bathyarchaeia archaeon]